MVHFKAYLLQHFPISLQFATDIVTSLIVAALVSNIYSKIIGFCDTFILPVPEQYGGNKYPLHCT